MNDLVASGQLDSDDNGDLKKGTYLTLQIIQNELIEVRSLDGE